MNIPLYDLSIDPGDFKELQRDVWIEDPVPAKLITPKRQLDIDIAYRGSHIREFKKRSYQISFFQPALYRRAKELHLNAEFKDPSFMRNKLSLDFFSDLGCLSPQSQHVFLTLNGENQGIYLELESVDEYFLAKRNLPKGAIFYAINGDGNFSLMSKNDKRVKKSLLSGYEKKYGKDQDHLYLEKMILNINTLTRSEFEKEAVKFLDIDKYLRWLVGVVLTQNFDGFVHNYALYRNGETGRFEMIPWDYDATWGRDVHGRLFEYDFVPIEGYNTLTARILDVDVFRKRYQNLLTKSLDSKFTKEYMKPKIDGLAHKLRPYLLKDPYKKNTLSQFDREPYVIAKFIEDRRKFIKSQLYKLD